MKIFLGLALGFAFSTAAFASDVTAKVQLISNSPAYFSAVDGSFTVTYKNTELATGTQVWLHYGFESSSFENGLLTSKGQWLDIDDVELTSVAPNIWQAKILKQRPHANVLLFRLAEKTAICRFT
jgi:hypothetical protein